jgi:hypothetical protein
MLRKLTISVPLLAIIGCAHAKKKPEPVDPSQEILSLYKTASNRLISKYLDNGTWVVSRHPDGSSEHQGEGLIWSGVALSALSCDDGKDIEANLQRSIMSNDGALVRYEPLGEYRNGREVTLDGALGLYLGVARRIQKCPGTGSRSWKEVLNKHCAYLSETKGLLNQAAPATLGGFRYLLDLLSFTGGACGTGNPGNARGVETEVAGWAMATVASRSAAYRLNLGFIALETLELLDKPISSQGRDEWCAATNGAGIPTIDAWCGRGDLRAWIAGYQYNQWEYRHQRAAWESPDGDGDTTPGLDLLVALKQSYNL